MSDPKFSPGPWRIDDKGLWDRGWTTIVNRSGFVAKCELRDANIIASAPAMYEMLRGLALEYAWLAPPQELEKMPTFRAIRDLLGRIDGD